MRLPCAAAVAVVVWYRQVVPLWGLEVAARAGLENENSAAMDLVGMSCDSNAAEAICFGDNKEQVLLPPALPDGIVGYWNFDDSLPVDISGNHFHGMGPVQAGPSFAGQGSSAHFLNSRLMEVRHQDKLSLQDFSYTFWLHLLDDPAVHQGLRVCPIVRKGGAANKLEDGEAPLPSAPAILLDRQTRHLHIEVGTAGGPPGDLVDLGTEAFVSNARLARGRWYHIAVVRLDKQRRTRLYVNGILDASQRTKGFTALNNSAPLYVGGDPAVRDQCNVPMYIDELKIYNRPLDHDEIQAEAAPSLAGVEPSFLRLACVDCPLVIAQQNCPDKYHICNSLELHMGGYQVARTLGWLQHGAHVWSHATSLNAQGQEGPVVSPSFGGGLSSTPAPAENAGQPSEPTLGLGLCCVDST